MANKQQNKASDLDGLFIYHDQKNRTVYYDWLTKTGYILTNSDVKQYTLYSSRLPLSIVMGVFTYIFFDNIVASYIVGIITFIVTNYFFRTKFLSTLPALSNYIPPKREKYIEGAVKNMDYWRLLFVIVTMGAGCYGFIYNILRGAFTDWVSLVMVFGLIVLTAGFGVMNLIALFIKLFGKKS